MSNGEWTPGPWEWRELGGAYCLVSATRHVPIVLTAGYSGQNRGCIETRDADGYLERITPQHPNARLIAAAPELLAACRAAYSALGFPIDDESLARVTNQLANAIAQATREL